LQIPAEDTENIDSVVVNNNQLLIQKFITEPLDLGTTIIPGGEWEFDIWGSVSPTSNTNTIVAEVWRADSSGNEISQLFSVETAILLGTVSEHVVETVQSDFTCAVSDRLAVKFYGKTNATSNRTISLYYEGSEHYTHIHTPISVIGPQGPTGSQGETGLQGATGLQGVQGNTGVQGETGAQGETGLQGITGLTGTTGIQGLTGGQGQTGIQGETGLQGPTGIQGNTGTNGATGLQGPTGLQGITGSNIGDWFDFTPQAVAPSSKEGRTWYDSTSHQLYYDTEIANYAISPGRQLVTRVYNGTGSTIGIGKVVYIDGVAAGTPSVDLALGSDLLRTDTIGVTSTSIPDGTFGYIINYGLLSGLNTNGFTPGQEVWLSDTTAGKITPTRGIYSVKVGYALTIDTISGSILTAVGDPEASLAGLNDVNITNLLDGEILKYDSTQQKWINTTGIAGGGSGATGLQGPTGIQGVTGVQGAGFTGLQGLTGMQGETGIAGVGTTGLQGDTGLDGVTGVQGIQGQTGMEGATGIQGVTGTGAQGATGLFGSTGIQGVTGPGGGGTTNILGAWNTVSRYSGVDTSGEEVWLVSSSTVFSGLTWDRSGTTMTVYRNSHGHATGSRVLVRNTNMDYQSVLIDSTTANSFNITTANSDGTTGTEGAYSLGFTYSHNGSPKTGGTVYAPTGDHADVQLLTLRIRTGNRQGSTYNVVVPASAVNGAGANTSLSDCFVPDYNVRTDSDSLAAVGATIQTNISGSYSTFQIGALSSLSRMIILHF
jgi:hypothetical protein